VATGRDRSVTAGRVIDSHQHFWLADALGDQTWRTASHQTIARGFDPTHLHPDLRRVGIDFTVLIQSADNSEENRRLARFAQATDFVAAVVAWLPVAEPEHAADELEAVADMGKLRGVRCLIGRDPLDWLTDQGVLRSFRRLAQLGLSWDVVPVTARQVDNVCALAARVPDLTVVIDHLARPPLDSRGWDPWAQHVERLAQFPNVAVKLSIGVDVLEAWKRWDADQLSPYVAHALSCFGPARAMLASNWPVVLLRRDYSSAWQDLDAAAAATGLNGDELALIRGGTAARCYRLNDAVHHSRPST
jgi:L-fuconolactonase